MNQCILPLNTQPTNPTQPTSCLPRGHYRNVGHYLVLPSPARTLILQESKSLSSWQTFPLETYGEKRCGLMFHIVSPCNNHEYVSINSWNVKYGNKKDKDFHWVVVSNSFYFCPYLGKWSNLTNIFQMGWNHQPVQCTCIDSIQLCCYVLVCIHTHVWKFPERVESFFVLAQFLEEILGAESTLKCPWWPRS